MIFCHMCGSKNTDDSIFCEYCGERLDKKPSPKKDEPKEPFKFSTIDFNHPFETYVQFMGDNDLYRVGLSKFEGVVLEKDENEAIRIFVYLARKGHINSMIKLADICLKDKETKVLAIIILKKAYDAGSDQAGELLEKLGVMVRKKDDRPIIKPIKEIEDLDDEIEPKKPSILDDISDKAANKTVLIKTVSQNGSRIIKSTGFITSGGYVITSYKGVNRGNYKTISGTLNGGGNYKQYKLKLLKASSYYGLAVLKFNAADLEDLEYDDNIDFALSIEKSDEFYSVGNIGKSMEVKRLEYLGEAKKSLSEAVRTAYKFNGKIDDDNISPIVLDRNGDVVGIITCNTGSIQYAIKSEYIIKILNKVIGE